MKKLITLFLMAFMAITSAISLSSCMKDASPISDIRALPDRDNENKCPICNRNLIHTPAGITLSPHAKTSPYSCFHEYKAGESCPYVFCNLYSKHHYHFFYVGDDVDPKWIHLGGGAF